MAALPDLAFVHRQRVVRLQQVPLERTLLEVLREDLHACDTKEGCAEGDCGACTVVLGEAEGGVLRYRAVNSCIRMAHATHGMAVWTAQDLTQTDGSPHPVQAALLSQHATQCAPRELHDRSSSVSAALCASAPRSVSSAPSRAAAA